MISFSDRKGYIQRIYFMGRNRAILSASSAFDGGLSKLHGDFATQANTAAVCAFLTIWAKSLRTFTFI